MDTHTKQTEMPRMGKTQNQPLLWMGIQKATSMLWIEWRFDFSAGSAQALQTGTTLCEAKEV